MVFALPASFSLHGAVRLLNSLVAAASTLSIGCRGINSAAKSDADPLITLLLFGVVVVGNFIPWAGAVFSAAAVGIMLLLDGEKSTERDSAAS